MNRLLYKRTRPIIYITLCLTFICWIFLFAQMIRSYLTAAGQSQSIPAFQPASVLSSSTVSYPISILSSSDEKITSDNYNRTNPDIICNFLKKYDKNIKLVSYHKEKNYVDYYFYSPLIQQKETSKGTRNFNLQAAVTNTNIYLGSPFIQYDF